MERTMNFFITLRFCVTLQINESDKYIAYFVIKQLFILKSRRLALNFINTTENKFFPARLLK